MTCDKRDVRWVVSDSSNICLVNVASGESRVIFNRAAGATEPAWSPNGKRIAFVLHPRNEEDADTEIVTMQVDGSGFRKVTNNGRNDYSPDWQAR